MPHEQKIVYLPVTGFPHSQPALHHESMVFEFMSR